MLDIHHFFTILWLAALCNLDNNESALIMPLSKSVAQYMLEDMPVNILLCDAKSFKITYANRQSRETLGQLGHLLPRGVTGDTIIGQNIDVFHKNPEMQRRLLANPENLPHEAMIRLGKEYLSLKVGAIPGSFGKPSAFMLTWAVCTEAEKLKRMADVMPINLMMADAETLEIDYVNATSVTTLKQIEHLLPIKVDQVLGSCIDIFHKHPEHQRAMLRDPANLPHRAKIRLGDEWLELNVAAIQDDRGGYIGPMVSWRVITAEVTMAENVRAIAQSVAAASTQLSHNASSTAQISKQTSELSGNASEVSAQITSNVSNVAAAAEELSQTIRDITGRVDGSMQTLNEANAQATQASDVINQQLPLPRRKLAQLQP